MSITSPLLGLVLSGLVLMSGSAFAASTAIEGIVKDANGKVMSNAEVRIEAKDKSLDKTTKSDAKGHYFYSGLNAGTYRVSLIVNGVVKASINNVAAKLGETAKLNFELKNDARTQAAAKSGKSGKHLVWMSSQTGTNIGGRWVEVDDNTAGKADGVTRTGAGVINSIQSNSGRTLGGN